MTTPPQALIADCRTTSDRIRVLAANGMARADIARFLNIRYQHVRNVLVRDAPGPFPAAKRSVASRVAEIVDPPRHDPLDQQLLARGFAPAGAWTMVEGRLALPVQLAMSPGVYVFLVRGVAMYVGVTKRNLRRRLAGYVTAYAGQSTNVRLNRLLIAAIESGDRVEIWTASPRNDSWNGLPVDMVAGLEAGLIRTFAPPWNKLA